MSKTAIARLTWFILGLGLVVTAVVYAWLGRAAAQSAAVGAGVALCNWYLLRFIVARVVSGNVRSQAKFSLLLVAKMGALMGLVLVLIRGGLVQPVAFTAGLSSLVVGALLGCFVHILRAPVSTGATETSES
jgi:hypothetical protein